MKQEACPFEQCRFSRVCNHIHCIRSGCNYVLHSSGQLYSHKRKHERQDNEMAYRKFKLAQSMMKSFGDNQGPPPGFPTQQLSPSMIQAFTEQMQQEAAAAALHGNSTGAGTSASRFDDSNSMTRFEDSTGQRLDDSSSLPRGDDVSSEADDSQEHTSNGNEDDEDEDPDEAVNMSGRSDSSPPPPPYHKYTAAMLAGTYILVLTIGKCCYWMG